MKILESVDLAMKQPFFGGRDAWHSDSFNGAAPASRSGQGVRRLVLEKRTTSVLCYPKDLPLSVPHLRLRLRLAESRVVPGPIPELEEKGSRARGLRLFQVRSKPRHLSRSSLCPRAMPLQLTGEDTRSPQRGTPIRIYQQLTGFRLRNPRWTNNRPSHPSIPRRRNERVRKGE